jgi:hypothetical protein
MLQIGQVNSMSHEYSRVNNINSECRYKTINMLLLILGLDLVLKTKLDSLT